MFDAGLHPIFLIITLFRHFPLCTFSVCFYFILVSNTWFICLLYSGYVVEHMNTHRRTNLATLSVYLHSLYLLTFICSVSFIQALAVLFSCTEHEGDEGGAGALAYNSRQTPWFSMKWTEQISWYEFTQADVWSHDTLVDQMHALFWSPRWPSQQFQHLNLVRRQKILFYFFEGFLNQSTLDFFFQSEMGSVWFSNLQQAYRVALWDKCAWIAACWIWGYLDSSLSPLAAGCRAVGISKWCECKRWLCREVLTSRALLFGSCSVNMETWWNWSSGYKASLPTFPYLSLTSEIRLGGHKKVVINSSV